MGSVIGGSEQNTKGILASTIGKVLVIDEAYGLFAGSASGVSASQSDPFRAAVVDTIVAEIQSTPGEDRCVLLLGYENEMRQMFQNVNPGLSRRFPIDQAFTFEDFTKEQMDQILTLKLKQQDLGITELGRQVALEVIERARNRLHFGNAGEIDILLNKAKMRLQKRVASLPNLGSGSITLLDAPDFDEDFDRADKDGVGIATLFEGVVGCKDIIRKLEGYQQLVKSLRKLKIDPSEEIPFNFLFRGPPGKFSGVHILRQTLKITNSEQEPARLALLGRWVKFTMTWAFSPRRMSRRLPPPIWWVNMLARLVQKPKHFLKKHLEKSFLLMRHIVLLKALLVRKL